MASQPSAGRQNDIPITPREAAGWESTWVSTCDDPVVESAARFIRSRPGARVEVSEVGGFLRLSRRTLEIRFRRQFEREVYEGRILTTVARARRGVS